MNKLVFGNLVHRPLRSLISVFAVAIEVVMILSIAAALMGMLNGTKTRTSGIGMDMMARPGTASNLMGSSGAPAPLGIANKLRAIPDVEVVAPVNIHLSSGEKLENIYGIDFESYNALKPFVFKEGGPFQGPMDAIIDDFVSSDKHLHVGDTISILNNNFRISGVVEHGKGGRKFIPITTMDELDGDVGASAFYLKTKDAPKNQEAVRAAILKLGGMEKYDVETLDELMAAITPERTPGFNIALHIVIGISVVIGFLVIFQSMYTAVMERTREIGILKSMGAGSGYIVGLVLRESGMLAVAGIFVGILLSFLLEFIFHNRMPEVDFVITYDWVLKAVGIALAGALLGALYPAWKAARKDPIDALSYE
ncbi:MAG TPA: FtsX-like permease family protein [Acidobacteriaceae bacterium]|nr:FtsX-like permease family protein [Acidobacteriaceae bacterium]